LNYTRVLSKQLQLPHHNPLAHSGTQ